MTANVRRIVTGTAALAGGILLASCYNKPAPVHPPGAGNHKQFEELDTNKDGRLSYTEFSRSWRARKASSARTLFNQIDTNDDDYISVNEWKAYRLNNKKSN